MSISWQDIDKQLHNLQVADGGFSAARRGLLRLSDGTEVFVKIGLHDDTKAWAKKEIGVYRFLKAHKYPHAPKLIAVNDDETGFAIEACTAEDGWDWQANWDQARLAATEQAIKDLAAIELNDAETAFFTEKNISQADSGWRELGASTDKQKLLLQKLRFAGAEDITTQIDFAKDATKSERYKFVDTTLVHHDMRADNCAWHKTLQQVRVIDWNWSQLGDWDIQLAALLTSVQNSGFDLTEEYLNQLKPAALHWVAGFWFRGAITPIWKDGPEHLRDLQLISGVVALRLANKISADHS